MAKTNNSKGKKWPPNVGENMGRVRFRKKMPRDVELAFGKKHFQEYLPIVATATFDEAFEAAKPAKLRIDGVPNSRVKPPKTTTSRGIPTGSTVRADSPRLPAY